MVVEIIFKYRSTVDSPGSTPVITNWWLARFHASEHKLPKYLTMSRRATRQSSSDVLDEQENAPHEGDTEVVIVNELLA